MDQDKWIRKLARILTDMGFEDKGPATHRKYVYNGDRCTQECNLVIQSHAKETSKRAIVGYVKRTMRAAGADPQMIAELDKLPLGFIAHGMKIDEIDDALYDALVSNDAELAAEIGIELGKQLKDPANTSYTIRAFSRKSQHQNNLNNLTSLHRQIENIILDLVQFEIDEHIYRHGSFFIDTRSLINEMSQLDDDISEKYQIRIKGIEGKSNDIAMTCIFIDEIAAAFTEAGYVNVFSASVDDDDGEGDITLFDTQSIYSIRLLRPPSATIPMMQDLISVLDAHRTMMAITKPKS